MKHLLTAVLLLCTFTACADEPADTAPNSAKPSQAQTPPAQTQTQTQPAQTPPTDTPTQTQPTDAPAQTQPKSPDENSAEAWLDRIEHRAVDIHTLTAELRYDRNQLLLGDQQRRFGTLVYQTGPPPKFAVHFDRLMVDDHWSQPDLWYLYDGRWLLKRDHQAKTAVRYQLVPDDAQAQVMELGEGPFPIPLNLKKDRVLARYEVAIVSPKDTDPANSIHLQLTPRPGIETDLTRIDLWFDRESLLPVNVVSEDDSQTQTAVRLINTQINPELEGQTFDTSLPTEPGWQTDENRLESTNNLDTHPPKKPTD